MTALKPDENWWRLTWKERETLLQSHFGVPFPSGQVTGFFWDNPEIMIPGACAMTFPPKCPQRIDWLTISHGLTQPLEIHKSDSTDLASGYGYEFGFLTREHSPWCAHALYLILTYLQERKRSIDRGSRVPMWFSQDNENTPAVNLGTVPHDVPIPPLGLMRAMLFWPYMLYPGGFDTSTGYFSILLGTSITEEEWDMAKSTSSSHLLLLLFEAGIGQVCDINRRSIIEQSQWRKRWREIQSLSGDQTDDLLLEYSP